jgi:hypothetical protein
MRSARGPRQSGTTPVHHPRWGGWWYRSYHRLYRHAEAVIALTECQRRTLDSLGLGVDERRISVLGAGPCSRKVTMHP